MLPAWDAAAARRHMEIAIHVYDQGLPGVPPGLTNLWQEHTSAILLAAGALEVDRLVGELYRRSSGRHLLPLGSQRLDGGDKAKRLLQELITSEGFYLPAAITYSGILPIEGNLSEASGYLSVIV